MIAYLWYWTRDNFFKQFGFYDKLENILSINYEYFTSKVPSPFNTTEDEVHSEF